MGDAAMALTGQFWFRKTWTGKMILLVQEEKSRWFGRGGTTKLRWRDAKHLDLAEPKLQPLMNMERLRRSVAQPGSIRPLYSVLSPEMGEPSEPRGRTAA